jgi:Bcr/CflA subfamily drug resistance transporter
MTQNLFRTALILGLVSAIGPFAIDMYLPALPSIGQSLAARADMVQLSLTAFFVVLGVCQLVYGPVADMVGRKPPLYFGVGLFGLGSIGCALAPTIEVLIAFRVIEAIGACAGMVVPRAIVRDLHTGAEAARLISLLMLVFSISPILAPLAGSLIIAVAGWRGVFWTVTIAAALGLALMASQLEETRPVAARSDSSWASAVSGYRRLLVDPGFLGITFLGAFGISSFFVYLANSSFVLINYYGLSPTVYSLFFAVNAISFFGAAQLNGWLTGRFGHRLRGGDDRAPGRGQSRHGQPVRAGRAAVRRQRLPRPGHPDLGSAGHGGTGRHRRHGLGAPGSPADGHGRRRHDDLGAVCRRHPVPHGGRDCDLRDHHAGPVAIDPSAGSLTPPPCRSRPGAQA